MTERFAVGQDVLYRGPHVDDSGKTGPPVICDVKPAVVVEDSAELMVLFVPMGTETLLSKPLPANRPKPWGPGEWELAPGTWRYRHTLFLHRPREWRSTWVRFSPDWEPDGFYVNLQEPLWRTQWGFDIRDLQLDIVVAADGSWRWKDEDDLARSIENGLICAKFAERVRETAALSVREIEAPAWPFDRSYDGWRPDPAWGTPRLPEGEALEEALRWSETDSLGRF